MWARNLLFVGLVLGGLGALAAGLFPTLRPMSLGQLRARADTEPDFRAVVGQVNDAFRQQWAREGLRPAAAAPDTTLARRLALALNGTIPSLQEIRQFEMHPGPDRLHDWLERIFTDRRHADYLAERLARSYVGNEDGPFVLYRRRRFVAWLSDELSRNRPYDELVRELLTAEGRWTDQPAANFVTVTFTEAKKDGDPERLAGRVTRAFLGLRLDCAQCHNHPFQPWKQQDFQALASFFGQTHIEFGLRGVYDGDGEYEYDNRKAGGKRAILPRVPFQPDLLPAEGTRRARLAAWVTHPENPYFGRAITNRVWAFLFGRPLHEPLDDLGTGDEVPPALDLLARDFVTHGHDLRRLIRVIAATDVFQLDSAADHEITDEHEKAWAVFPLTRLRPEQVVGGVTQAASLETLDYNTHILWRAIRYGQQNAFVTRYGDNGEDEFEARAGTIAQRLLMMNGEVVHDRTKGDLFNAPGRIAALALDDAAAVEAAYLTVLTRRPTEEERAHFEARLRGTTGPERAQRLEDLCWTLINSTEFSWNH
jgi:hypothetical protein